MKRVVLIGLDPAAADFSIQRCRRA